MTTPLLLRLLLSVAELCNFLDFQAEDSTVLFDADEGGVVLHRADGGCICYAIMVMRGFLSHRRGVS